jgi:hypothetical protein
MMPLPVSLSVYTTICYNLVTVHNPRYLKEGQLQEWSGVQQQTSTTVYYYHYSRQRGHSSELTLSSCEQVRAMI